MACKRSARHVFISGKVVEFDKVKVDLNKLKRKGNNLEF